MYWVKLRVSAWAFSDEHQLSVGIAGAEDDLLASQLGELATLAVGANVVEYRAQFCFASVVCRQISLLRNFFLRGSNFVSHRRDHVDEFFAQIGRL